MYFLDLINAPAIALLIKLTVLGIAAFYLFPRQLAQALRPKDWLTRLRWRILAALGVSIISILPSVAYQYIRAVGGEAAILQDVVSITTNISLLAFMILIVSIFNYSTKNEDK